MKWVFMLFLALFSILVKAQIITTVAGNGMLGYGGDGTPATSAKLHLPGKAIFDANGNMFIADSWGHRIRKVDGVTHIISTIAGTGVAGYNGDDIVATAAQLDDPVGLALDASGNLYVGDCMNERVRKIDMFTNIISTVAGNGVGAGTGFGAFSGDGGLATNASLNGPCYIAIDMSDNLYIGDCKNYRVRRVSLTSDSINTFAGSGIWGYSGDGLSATVAAFNFLQGVSVDNIGNLFICDTNSTIRKVNALTRIITTVAGIHITGDTGDGAPATTAEIENPFDIAFDAIGNYYIAEFKGRVRKVDTFGIIHTVAGTTLFGYNGDGIPATSAELNETTGLATDACGNLYIADVGNERIRKVAFNSILAVPSISLSGVVTAPVGSTVTITATVANAGSSYIIEWFDHGIEFTTTTAPSVMYTKGAGADTITAKVVSTATYGCYDSTLSAGHFVTSVTNDISNLTARNSLFFYPNPAHDQFTVLSQTKINQITISNLVGQTVYTQAYDIEKAEVNIAGLPEGVYIVKVMCSNGSATVNKIIKQ